MHFATMMVLATGLLTHSISASPLADALPYPLADVEWSTRDLTSQGAIGARDIETRATWWDGQQHCDWPPSNPRAIGVEIARGVDEAINRLKGYPASTKISIGARTCGRIACSYNVGVVVCNDAFSTSTQPANDFGKYVDMIKSFCLVSNWPNPGYNIKGQFFDRKSYNVIVRGDSC